MLGNKMGFSSRAIRTSFHKSNHILWLSLESNFMHMFICKYVAIQILLKEAS